MNALLALSIAALIVAVGLAVFLVAGVSAGTPRSPKRVGLLAAVIASAAIAVVSGALALGIN